MAKLTLAKTTALKADPSAAAAPVVSGWMSEWPAHQLEAQLEGRLAGLTPTELEEEEPLESAEEEDLSELWDWEDWAEDPDDWNVPESETETQRPGQDRQRVDLIVEKVGDDLVLISGLADLLPRLSSQSGLARQYHLALRQRITESLALGQVLLQRQREFFLGQRPYPIALPGPDLSQAAQTTEKRFSNLKNALSLQTPDGRIMKLADFVAGRTVEPETDRRVLRLFLEQLDQERASAPLSDAKWLKELDGQVQSPQAVGQVRKRLGIPGARERQKMHATSAHAEEFLERLARSLSAAQREQLARTLAELRLTNSVDRKRAETWLEQLRGAP